MNRIGTMLHIYKDDNLREKFKRIRNLGAESCQLTCWDKDIIRDLNVAKEAKRIAKEENVFISHFWCGYEYPCKWNFFEGQHTLGLVPPETREDRKKTLLAGIDFAATLGVKYIVTHAGFIPENPYDENYLPTIEAIKEIALKGKEKGISFLFETGQETPVTLLRAIEDIGLDNLGINLDPANLILYGKANPIDALDIIGKYVKGVHAKDGLYPTDGKNLGKEVKVGLGKVNFKEFLRKLIIEYNYDYDLTIEREIGEGSIEQNKDIVDTIKYLRETIKEIEHETIN